MSPLGNNPALGRLGGLAVVLWIALAGVPAAADDVVLENGNVFEGVIVVTETAERVRIRLAHGEMSLPRSWIARIERAPAPLAGYLERREALLARPDAGVEDWLALARWARPRELAHGYREALLEASRIEPRHPDLAPLLRGIGYVLDPSTDLWISAAELRRAEAAAEAAESARRRAAEQRAARDRGDGGTVTEETLSRAVEALALAELERETRSSEREARRERTYFPVRVGAYQGPIFPVAFFPGLRVAAVGGGEAPEAAVDPYESLRRRQPGSLLVTRPGGSRVRSLSRLRRQPGALPLGNPH